MTIQSLSAAQAMGELERFGAVIDARSPAEFAHDHLPGAVNWPVLDDEERRLVGIEYAQVSAFEARKRGAALVAKNIAAHIEREVMDKGKDWRPLVYCWRGGQRSGSMAWFLDQMGFRTYVLAGGYKAFRAAVRAELAELPARIGFEVVCGRTGSGKTRLLGALRDAGAQVLDLEGLARHRGSVLGVVPGCAQPSQKAFETALWDVLRRFDPQQPVFVESESKKIGNLRVPEAVIERMRASARCLHVEMPDAGRLALLQEDYAFLAADPGLFCRLLDGLVALRGRETVAYWQQRVRAGAVAEVFGELMRLHYDPGYERSMRANFTGFAAAETVRLEDGSPPALAAAAKRLLVRAT
ncbi:MAG: tRNA 2-selenouridine(34) synthase MnmH [Burkholderiaceae bacterium]|nr:tRNA 2-selenouridine(34) synthase MnmH [Burkholderiaceae bacterium]